jgi:DnaJ-class molecular chaperone
MTVRVCPECDGQGKVEVEYTVGGYTPDRYVEIRVRWQECEACGGWGEVDDA